MIDLELNQRLVVRTEGDAGPYLMVPVQQLPAVEAVLRGQQIPFSITRDAIRLDGHEAIAVIDFGRGANANFIQAALDAH